MKTCRVCSAGNSDDAAHCRLCGSGAFSTATSVSHLYLGDAFPRRLFHTHDRRSVEYVCAPPGRVGYLSYLRLAPGGSAEAEEGWSLMCRLDAAGALAPAAALAAGRGWTPLELALRHGAGFTRDELAHLLLLWLARRTTSGDPLRT